MKHPGIYSKLCYIHMAIYVIYFAALEILPVRNFLNQHLGVLYTLIGVSGAFLLVLDFFSRRIMFQIQHARILMLFFVATIASICINYQYDLAGNMKCIMWMAVQVFLFGAIDKKESGTVHVKRLCMLFDIFILIWLIGVLWALWQYIVCNRFCRILPTLGQKAASFPYLLYNYNHIADLLHYPVRLTDGAACGLYYNVFLLILSGRG